MNLSRYIHLNPVVAGYVYSPADWDYSSYPEYAGLRAGSLPKPDVVLRDFESREAYIAFVEKGIDDFNDIEKWMLD